MHTHFREFFSSRSKEYVCSLKGSRLIQGEEKPSFDIKETWCMTGLLQDFQQLLSVSEQNCSCLQNGSSNIYLQLHPRMRAL